MTAAEEGNIFFSKKHFSPSAKQENLGCGHSNQKYKDIPLKIREKDLIFFF